jgi:hypothetical protein
MPIDCWALQPSLRANADHVLSEWYLFYASNEVSTKNKYHRDSPPRDTELASEVQGSSSKY